MRGSSLSLVLALGLLICGCGGGGSTAGSPSSSQSQDSNEAQQETAKSPAREEGAEVSLEGYGTEAGGSDRETLLATFHGYLGALAQADDEKACSYLAASVRESLRRLAAKAKKSLECPQLLEALFSPQAGEIARAQDEGKITRVRIKGDDAFVVFHAPGARLYQLTMAREGGEWKTTALSASVLAPSIPRQ
jgi:hypothetical protein